MKTLTAILSLFFSFSAFASPIDKIETQASCYKTAPRSATELKSDSPAVHSLSLKLYASPYSTEELMILLDIHVELALPAKKRKGQTHYRNYSDTMVCENVINGKSPVSSLNCYVDCGEGHALISWKTTKADDGSITFENKGFLLYGGCGEDVDESDVIWLDPKVKGNHSFILQKQNCN
jgi:hypothetical protein